MQFLRAGWQTHDRDDAGEGSLCHCAWACIAIRLQPGCCTNQQGSIEPSGNLSVDAEGACSLPSFGMQGQRSQSPRLSNHVNQCSC